MIIYWSMYLFPAFLTLNQVNTRRRVPISNYSLVFAFLLVVIGLRETGGDYVTYKAMFDVIARSNLQAAFQITDPLFALLNWSSSLLGLGFYGVNSIIGIIYLYGFYRFARYESEPILMLTISISYQVIVTVMGYSREGAAVGLLMWGISYLYERKPLHYLGAIAAATGFHASAAAFVPLVFLGFSWRRYPMSSFAALVLACLSLGYAYSALTNQLGNYYDNYVISKHYSSQGALIRAVMTASAALVFLYYRRNWKRLWPDRDIWLVFSLAGLAMVPLTFIASTAADRIGLYLIPLQLVVFARLPVLQQNEWMRGVCIAAILVSYAILLGTWLYYGQFTSELWLPYRSPILGQFS